MNPRTSTGTQGVARTGTVLAVGVIAAIQSYSHIYDLAQAHFQSPVDARLLPLSVDGLIIAASLALSTAPKLARWMLGVGVTATVSANVAYGFPHGLLAALVSAWPGISFVCGPVREGLVAAPRLTLHASGRLSGHLYMGP